MGVVAVNTGKHLPTVGSKTLRGVVGEPAVYFAINGDAIVIIDTDQFAQAQSTRQRGHFVGNTFHQAAIAYKGIGVVVNNVMARAVELSCQGFLSQCKTHSVSQALPQWASGGFYARGVAVFRVARGFRVQLAEVLDVIDGNVVAAQVQQ